VFQENILPAFVRFLERKVESKLSFGYDVGRGFVVGEEECRELLNIIIEHEEIRDRFKNHCDKNRLAVIKELGKEKEHPQYHCVLLIIHTSELVWLKPL